MSNFLSVSYSVSQKYNTVRGDALKIYKLWSSNIIHNDCCPPFVNGNDSLPLGVLGVSDGVAVCVFQEDLQDADGLLVDQTRSPLNTASPSQAPYGGFGDPFDVVTENIAVPLASSLV